VPGRPRGAARVFRRRGDDSEDRLAEELPLAFRQDRIVVHVAWRNVVLAGHVRVGKHIDDAGCCSHG